MTLTVGPAAPQVVERLEMLGVPAQALLCAVLQEALAPVESSAPADFSMPLSGAHAPLIRSVTTCVFVARPTAHFLAQSQLFIHSGSRCEPAAHIQGVRVHRRDDPEDGKYRARVRILGLDGGRRSQRFIDLETFVNEADARHRALAAARSWIDAEDGHDKLALPSSFAPLPDREQAPALRSEFR